MDRLLEWLKPQDRKTDTRRKAGPSIFSTKYNPEGIRLGTAISLMVRKPERTKKPIVRFRQFWGTKKREELLKSLKMKKIDSAYNLVNPTQQFRYSFRSLNASKDYMSWPTVLEICEQGPFNGPIERRGNSLITLESERTKLERVRDYLDPKTNQDMIKTLAPLFMRSSGEFKADDTRSMLLKKGVHYNREKITRYPFKPMDTRVAYLDSEIQPLFSRPSPELLNLRKISNNAFLIARDTADKYPEGSPFYYSSLVCDYDFISGHARHIPVWVPCENQATLFGKENTSLTAKANLSSKARGYLTTLGIMNPDSKTELADMLWMHFLAIGYSPIYLKENADGIRAGWPRLPLPNSERGLRDSAQLGRQVAKLLNTEESVDGITTGIVRPELKLVALISRSGGGPLDPNSGDLIISAGWGHGENVTMPGTGRVVERDYSQEELEMFRRGGKELGLPLEKFLELLGDKTLDIYLNNIAYWKNVPANVWNYVIGGYQVIKKWLSYREHEVLGRAITAEETREVTNAARRLGALLLLEPSLDNNYESIRSGTYSWSN